MCKVILSRCKKQKKISFQNKDILAKLFDDSDYNNQ